MQKSGSKKVLILNILTVLFVLLVVTGLYALLNNGYEQGEKGISGEAVNWETATFFNHDDPENALECFQCHISIGSEEPHKDVATDQCLACHTQSYEGLIALTEELEPNPHSSPHHEDMDCTICHQVHKESELQCAQCHTFDWMEDLDEDWLSQ